MESLCRNFETFEHYTSFLNIKELPKVTQMDSQPLRVFRHSLTLKRCSGVFWSVLKHSRELWTPKKISWRFWGILWCPGMFWDFPKHSSSFWPFQKGFCGFWGVIWRSRGVLRCDLRRSYAFPAVLKGSRRFRGTLSGDIIRCSHGFWVVLKGV